MSETSVRTPFVEEESRVPYRAVEGLIVKPLPTAKDGRPVYAVRARGRQPCSLPEEEYFIFTLLDGSPSLRDIEHEFRLRFGGGLSRPHFQEFMQELLAAGVVERIAVDAPVSQASPKPARGMRAAAVTHPSPDQPQSNVAPASIEMQQQTSGISLLPIYLLLAQLGSPVRFFVWLLVPAAACTSILSFDGDHPAIRVLLGLNYMLGGVINMLAAACIVLLTPVVARGAVAAFHGAPRETFRLRLTMRCLWNGLLDCDCIDKLPRKARVWTYAAPLLARCTLFVLGSLVWTLRTSAGNGPFVIAWLVAQAGLWSFLLTALPIWPGTGRQWMTAYFAVPVVYGDAE